MAVFGGLTKEIIRGQVTSRLVNARRALREAADVYAWLSAYSSADLVAVGFTQEDADALFSAAADISALYGIYTTGLPPSSYPQPASAYVYANSGRVVTGPQG